MPKVTQKKSLRSSKKPTQVRKAWSGGLSVAQRQFLKTYFFHLLFIFFLANYVLVRQLQLTLFAQGCQTREMIATDNRCLYIYGQQVYEKGTRTKPHKGNTCGSDVTAIIPAFHTQNMAKYLDPNLVGNVCSGSPAPTATPKPTPTHTPISQPTKTPTPQVTNTPRPQSTNTPFLQPATTPTSGQPTNPLLPTPTRQSTITIRPAARKTPTPKPSLDPSSKTPTQIPSPVLPNNEVTNNELTEYSDSGFGRLLSGKTHDSSAEPTLIPIISPPPATNDKPPVRTTLLSQLVFGSEIGAAASFALLVVSILLSGLKKMWGGNKQPRL